jgi:hypothetical protein
MTVNINFVIFSITHNIHHSRFIPEGVAEASQIFLRDAHVLPKLVMKNIPLQSGKMLIRSTRTIFQLVRIDPYSLF